METELLQKEAFDALKALAEIQGQIAMARADLANLEAEKDVYLDSREKEAQDRVIAVLTKMKDTFATIDKNTADLLGFRDGVMAFREDVVKLSENIKLFSFDFRKELEASKQIIDTKAKELLDIQSNLDKQKEILAGERESLEVERARVEEETAFLMDRRGAFERAWLELEMKLKQQ